MTTGQSHQENIARLKQQLNELYSRGGGTDVDAHLCEKICDQIEAKERLAQLAGAQEAPATRTGSHSREPFRSPIRRAIWLAIVSLGPDRGYQEYASWIAECLSDVSLAPFLDKRTDLAYAVRNNGKLRQRFHSELHKVQKAYKKAATKTVA